MSTNIKKIMIVCLTLFMTCILAGCGTMNPEAGKIDVTVAKQEAVFIEIPQETLDKCKKPRKQDTVFFQHLKEGKIKEKELAAAYVESYTGHVNCYLSKEEAVFLQQKLKEQTKTVKKDGN
jgi:hypothetical protein